MCDLQVGKLTTGADDLLVLAFGKDDALGCGLGPLAYAEHDLLGAPQAARELFSILFDINLHLRHSALDRSLSDGGGFKHQDARVEWLGNDVVLTEVQVGDSVGAQHHVGNVFLRQRRQGARRRNLHFFVDGSCSNVQRATEDKGEAENVVDLVGIVGPSRGHDQVCPGFFRGLVANLRHRISHGENDRLIRHGTHHVLGHNVGAGEAGEDIRSLHGFRQGSRRGLGGEAGLVGVHAFAAPFVNDALGVAKNNVFPLHPQSNVVLGAGNPGRSGAVDHHGDLADVLPHDLQRVYEGCSGDDCRPMLVVVEDGNRHGAPQGLLDVEAFRGFDVFQVDAADGWLEQLAEADDVVGILRTYFEVEHIDIREALE